MRYYFSKKFTEHTWSKLTIFINHWQKLTRTLFPEIYPRSIFFDLSTNPFPKSAYGLRKFLVYLNETAFYKYWERNQEQLTAEIFAIAKQTLPVRTIPGTRTISRALFINNETPKGVTIKSLEILCFFTLGITLEEFEATDSILGLSAYKDIILVENKPHYNEITRSILFEPEHFQAGVDILTYFGTVLREKHPDVENKVAIEQDELKIRMTITYSNGNRDIVERTLEEYGEVIMGRKQPEEFFDTPLQVIQLKQKLEIAKMEQRMAYQQLEFERGQHTNQIMTLDLKYAQLMDQLGLALTNHGIQTQNQTKLIQLLEEKDKNQL